DAGSPAQGANHQRREYRSTKQWFTDGGAIRSRDRRTLRHILAAIGQRALRRLWPAPSIHHVHIIESVSRSDGSCSALLAESRNSARHLRAHSNFTIGSAERDHAL